MSIMCEWLSVRTMVVTLLTILIAGESALISAGYRDNSDQLESANQMSGVLTIVSITAVVVAVGIFIYAIVHNLNKKDNPKVKESQMESINEKRALLKIEDTTTLDTCTEYISVQSNGLASR
jgi:hypothetical protein